MPHDIGTDIINDVLILSATGSRPVAAVWRDYVDVTRWPTWAPHLRAVEGVARVIAPGDTGQVVGPLGVRLRFEIVGVSAGSMTWSWQVRVGPVAVRMDHAVTTEGDFSRAWLRLHLPTPVAAAYAPLALLALRRLTRSGTGGGR